MESTTFKIYHNPNCTKSRATLKLLEERGVKIEIVEYLNSSLEITEIENLIKLLNLPLSKIVRTNEAVFLEQGLDLDDKEMIIKSICKNPILLERPIVVSGNRAVIGRPPENVLALFS